VEEIVLFESRLGGPLGPVHAVRERIRLGA
jgi:hypothetical protein